MEEKKKVSDAQKRAAEKYTKANYDEIKVRVPKGKKGIIQQHAANMGESTTAFINRAIDETMERDNAPCTMHTVSDTTDVTKTEKPERRYEPFTEDEEKKVDFVALLYDYDGMYRSQIAYKYGIDVLKDLLEKAKQQKKKNPPE